MKTKKSPALRAATEAARKRTAARKTAQAVAESGAEQAAGTVRKTTANPTRRTQAERREATRRKLVDATLHCLAEDGYAGTTINRIVERADVSHGASGHHFPSKAAMIQAAAEELMVQAWRRWGAALLGVSAADDRLDALLGAAWNDVFYNDRSDAFIELMLASKKDPELRERLQPMIVAAMKSFRQAAEHFFVAKRDDVDLYHMMVLTQWLFRGMAMDKNIAPDPAVFAPYVTLWKKIMSEFLDTRPGVVGPPATNPVPRQTTAEKHA